MFVSPRPPPHPTATLQTPNPTLTIASQAKTNSSTSSRDDQNYQWTHPSGDTFYYDNHDTVRFRVEEEHWFDQTPAGPSAAAPDPAAQPAKSPYTLLASMEDSGLGPCLWWDGEMEEGEEEGEE